MRQGIQVESYVIYYHAVCEEPGCPFRASAAAGASEGVRASIRGLVRQHVTSTGHKVCIEYGKETVYSPSSTSVLKVSTFRKPA